MSKPKQEVAPIEDRQLVMPEDMMADLDEFAGKGGSDKPEDRVLPFLAIVQTNSPQVNKRDEKYIEGIEVGDIFNTATNSFWPGSEGVDFVWSNFMKQDVEWKLRSEGGGYVASHNWPSGIQTKDVEGRRINPAGHQMVETGYYFGIMYDTGDPAVIGMSSTNLGASRRWHTLKDQFKVKNRLGQFVVAPTFSRIYTVKSVYLENEKGNWYGWKVSDNGWIDMSSDHAYIYHNARDFYRLTSDPEFRMGRPADVGEHTAGAPNDGDVPI